MTRNFIPAQPKIKGVHQIKWKIYTKLYLLDDHYVPGTILSTWGEVRRIKMNDIVFFKGIYSNNFFTVII